MRHLSIKPINTTSSEKTKPKKKTHTEGHGYHEKRAEQQAELTVKPHGAQALLSVFCPIHVLFPVYQKVSDPLLTAWCVQSELWDRCIEIS